MLCTDGVYKLYPKEKGNRERRPCSAAAWGRCHSPTPDTGEATLDSASHTLVQCNQPITQPPNPVITQRPAPPPRQARQGPHSLLDHRSPHRVFFLHKKLVNPSVFPPFAHRIRVGVAAQCPCSARRSLELLLFTHVGRLVSKVSVAKCYKKKKHSKQFVRVLCHLYNRGN